MAAPDFSQINIHGGHHDNQSYSQHVSSRLVGFKSRYSHVAVRPPELLGDMD